MFTIPQLLCATLLPLILALLAAPVLRRAGGSRALGAGALALIVAIAHAAAVLSVGQPLIPPKQGWNWLPWVAAAAAAVLPWLAVRGLRAVALVALGGVGAAVLLLPMLAGLGTQAVFLWTAAAAVAAGGAALVSAVPPQHPIAARLATVVVAGGAALAAGMSGSKDLALLAGILPLALCGSLLFFRSWVGIEAAAQLLLVWGLAMAGTYSDLPPAAAAILALALPLSWLAPWASRRFPALTTILTAVVLMSAALTVVVVWGQPVAAGNDGY